MRALLRAAPALTGWLAGVALAFHATLASGFTVLTGDFTDSRLLTYLSEHGWRWLCRQPQHSDLWSPPIFYPAANAAAYSDVLIGCLPFYAPWRLLGLAPDTSFVLALMAAATANYAAFYLLLRRPLGLAAVPAAAGAFLFAFASPRLAHVGLGHLQIQTQVWSVLVAYALCRLFGPPGRLPTWLWAVALPVAAVMQLYASFYLGWLLAWALLLLALAALVLPSCRPRLIAGLRAHLLPLTAGALLAAAPLAWLASHYLAAARQVGGYTPEDVARALPDPSIWFYRGPDAWFGEVPLLEAVGVRPPKGWPGLEMALGVGPLTTVLAAVGLWRARGRPYLAAALLASAAAVVLMTALWLPGEEAPLALYRLLVPYMPGGRAVRAPGRVVFVLLAVYGLGLALFLQGRRAWVVAVVAAVCVLEQGRRVSAFDRAEMRDRVADVVRGVSGRRPFFVGRLAPGEAVSPHCKLHVDAMLASLELGVPTVNGYSGNEPPDWWLTLNEPHTPQGRRDLERWLDDWLGRHHIAPAEVERLWFVGPDPGG
jgi:hypothetical protein